MKIVILDGYTENPGDLSWAPLEAFGRSMLGLAPWLEADPETLEAEERALQAKWRETALRCIDRATDPASPDYMLFDRGGQPLVATAFLADKAKMTRARAALAVTVAGTAIGALSSLSMGPLSDVHLFGMNFFDFLDYTTSRLVLPLTGLGAALFVGWKMSKADVRDELTNGGTRNRTLFNVVYFLIRYFAPIGILGIFLTILLG